MGVSAQLNVGFVKDIPVTLNMGYTLSYKHHTQPNVLNESFKPVDNSEYKNAWANYLSLSVKVW